MSARKMGLSHFMFFVFSVSGCLLVMSVWAAEVWPRPDPGRHTSFELVFKCYHFSGLALAVVLLLAGCGMYDGDVWGWWLSGFYAISTILLHLSIFFYRTFYLDQPILTGLEHAIGMSYAVCVLAALPFIKFDGK